MKITLTPDSPSQTFAFEGIVNILVEGGEGILIIERSVADSPFYQYNSVMLDGGCALNSRMEELGFDAVYKFKLETGSISEVNIYLSRPKYVN